MQNSIVMFTFLFSTRNTFMGKFGPKNQNDQFEVKLGSWTNSNMQNSMGMFTFLFSAANTLFGQIWSKMSKLSISLS